MTCSDDGSGAPASLAVQLRQQSPVAAPIVSVQVLKGGLATNTTDPVNGDANASPLVALNGSSGSYNVFVDKSDAGTESYELMVQCKTGSNGSGADTGTAISGTSTGTPIPALPPSVVAGLVASLLALAGFSAWRRSP
ncbi:MAG TPA: hypothetical protein VMS55_25145 [Myxococcota bacterium]|nr:hypothetical protein [Myxococcota bacterium]